MPYPGVPEKDWKKMERCVEQVMKQGHNKSSAIAICHNAIVKENAAYKNRLNSLLERVINKKAHKSFIESIRKKVKILVTGDFEASMIRGQEKNGMVSVSAGSTGTTSNMNNAMVNVWLDDQPETMVMVPLRYVKII